MNSEFKTSAFQFQEVVKSCGTIETSLKTSPDRLLRFINMKVSQKEEKVLTAQTFLVIHVQAQYS